MRCLFADLITEVPEAGGLAPRCQAYLYDGNEESDIVIHEDLYRREKYHPQISENMLAYMEAAYQFYLDLVNFNGFYLHSSAVVLDGKAYLFSGPCGAGKSTHTRLWQSTFGPGAVVINDDKPAIRYMDGQWIVYGTPWCGKDGINVNAKAPLAGVCFMKKAEENRIRQLTPVEAMQKILSQTIYKFKEAEQLDKLLTLMNRFLADIPVYELENRPESAAARLSYETMLKGAEEKRL